jgi:cell division protein FtsB
MNANLKLQVVGLTNRAGILIGAADMIEQYAQVTAQLVQENEIQEQVNAQLKTENEALRKQVVELTPKQAVHQAAT